MNVKRTVSLSEEEMKEVLGGDFIDGRSRCMQMVGGYDCTGYCESKYDAQLGHTVKQECKKVGYLPPTIDGERFAICECI